MDWGVDCIGLITRTVSRIFDHTRESVRVAAGKVRLVAQIDVLGDATIW